MRVIDIIWVTGLLGLIYLHTRAQEIPGARQEPNTILENYGCSHHVEDMDTVRTESKTRTTEITILTDAEKDAGNN